MTEPTPLDVAATRLAELVEALTRAYQQSGKSAMTEFRMVQLESAAAAVKKELNR
ncbi:MAG: hypothetical protein KG075_03895 [Alphaproteobacteria bacterium]|nr:hypothetical protein [Alphaproteobacteria bacterium]